MESLPFVRFDSNNRRGVGMLKSLQLVQHVALRACAVLKINHYPIESRSPDDFSGKRRSKVQETTDCPFAAEYTFAKVFHCFVPCGWVGNASGFMTLSGTSPLRTMAIPSLIMVKILLVAPALWDNDRNYVFTLIGRLDLWNRRHCTSLRTLGQTGKMRRLKPDRSQVGLLALF
jgi:hypothetical protein